MLSFQVEHLNNILSKLEQESSNGVFQINVETNGNNSQLSQIIALKQGRIIYGGSDFITPEALARRIAKKLDISIINAALKTSANKIHNKTSFKELFDLLTTYRILKLEQIQEVLTQDIIQNLEKILPCAGSLNPRYELKFDLSCKGLSWSELSLKLAERKLEWSQLLPIITSAMDVPGLTSDGLSKVSSITASRHCKQWIDGKRTIEEIAEAINQDPLKLAQDYYGWSKQGWITVERNSQPFATASRTPDKQEPQKANNAELVTILSVDDSPVVQTMIKRALSDRYNLLLANNGIDALTLLNANKNKIKLALLDVTMPDIDGLELCRTIRKIPHFVDLPIVMLTAKDGMFDKFKGKFAGSTEYLIKPVDREQLLATIQKYVFTSTNS